MSPESQLATKQASSANLIRFQDVNKLFKEMEDRFQQIARRAYELFDGRGRIDGHELEDWFKAESEMLQPVPVEIEDREKTLIVRADVPGFKAEELEIALEPGRLMISGQSESKKEQKEKDKVVYSEQRATEISRSLVLPAEVATDQVEAVLKDGRLEITMAKAEAKKATEKKVSVKAA